MKCWNKEARFIWTYIWPFYFQHFYYIDEVSLYQKWSLKQLLSNFQSNPVAISNLDIHLKKQDVYAYHTVDNTQP